MQALEDEQYQRSMAYYKDVQEQFRQASNSLQMDIERWYRRLADNNEISYASAKKLLKSRELEEFHWTVEQYIKAGEENALDQRWMKQLENASARYHIDRLEAMKLQVQQHAELLFTEYEGGMADFLHKNYAEQFYRTAYEVSQGSGVGFNLTKLDTRRIDALVKRPWAQDGKVFSDRIWDNKDKLVNNLHTELTQCIIRGESPAKAIDRLAKKMEVSKAQAGNLIMTESAAIASAAQKECFKELDLEKFEFDATLDGKTCDICQRMDGQFFTMEQFEVGVTAPPIHPRCRCCVLPGFDDWEELSIDTKRAARDPETGKTVYVDGNLKYEDWKEQNLDKKLQDISGYDGMTFMQKKETIFSNEEQIERLYDQKKQEELKVLTGTNIAEMESAQKKTKEIQDQIDNLKKENENLQKSLGMPTNAKERFYNQSVDHDRLPHEIRSDETDAVSAWTRTDYVFINDYKRTGNKGVRQESIKNAEILEKMLDRNIVKEPFTVKRGTDFNAMNHLFGGDNWKKEGYNVNGKIIVDKGFMATTPDLYGGFGGDIQMYIDVPVGAKGVYIGELSAAPDEKEFLLQCGTKLQVEKINIRYNKWGEPNYDVYLKVKVGDHNE